MNTQDAKNFAESLMAHHLSKHPGWRFQFDQSKRRLGTCNYDLKLITLSQPLTELNPETIIRNTILHEIAHVIAGYEARHGKLWKMIAQSVGARPERCTNADSVQLPKGRYIGVCPDCGAEFSLYRKSKILTQGAVHIPCKTKPHRGRVSSWLDTYTKKRIPTAPTEFQKWYFRTIDMSRQS
jgi:predicted SprT family Zn-dependent metalloprotease